MKLVSAIICVITVFGVIGFIDLFMQYQEEYYNNWTLSIYNTPGFGLKYEENKVDEYTKLYNKDGCVSFGIEVINWDQNDRFVSYECKAGYRRNDDGVYIWDKICNHNGCRD
jgi:hypothetical protein